MSEQRKCEVCSGAYTARSAGRRYCSRICAGIAKRDVPLPERAKRLLKDCPNCGKPFETGGRGGKHHHTRYCSHACSVEFRNRKQSLCTPLSPEDAAYLAGFFDGEGCIVLFRIGEGIFLRIAVANTKLAVLEWCASVTGIGAAAPRGRPNLPTSAPQWIWTAPSRSAASVLRVIVPYLKVKRAQAELAVAFQERREAEALAGEHRGAWQEEYRLQMGALNKRGPAQ